MLDKKVIIRPVEVSDAADVHRFRIMPGVFETILALPCEKLWDVENFLRGHRDPLLGAEVDGHIVGMAGLEIPRMARRRHCGSVGIMVHRNYQGRGVGRALMTSLLDVADNWLMLKRVELTVFTDNERAIGLYKSLGFAIEGTKRCAAVKNGDYADEYLMARYNNRRDL